MNKREPREQGEPGQGEGVEQGEEQEEEEEKEEEKKKKKKEEEKEQEAEQEAEQEEEEEEAEEERRRRLSIPNVPFSLCVTFVARWTLAGSPGPGAACCLAA